MSEHVIGIDLGTTNSEVSVFVNGQVEVLTLDNGTQMLPSVVGLDESGQLRVGTEARNQLVLYPERTVCSIKRKMGSSERVSLGDRSYLPQEISAMILKELKLASERRLGEPVTKAVITVPAQFTDAQRQATREAGQIAGLEVMRILNEPTAASLAYESEVNSQAKTLLAFDLGGGTFDVSVVRLEGEVMEVLASSGDNMLGGDDFDAQLAEWILTETKLGEDNLDLLDSVSKYRLLKSAEAAKRQLTDIAYAQVIEPHVKTQKGEAVPVSVEVSRRQFEEVISPFVQDAMASVRKCLRETKLKPQDIDEVILVGGSTRSPIFAEAIQKEFGKRPRLDIQPDLAVAYGAGVMAARLMGERLNRILVDITPFSFGVSSLLTLDTGEYGPFFFSPIIPAGSPLPVSREELFETVCDGQQEIEVNVYEGENQDVRKNTLIGTFRIQGLADVPAGSPIVMAMKLDLDGLLTCTATEKDTGLNKRVTIANAMDKLSPEELSQASERIDALFPGEPQNGGQEKTGGENKVLTSQLALLERRLQKVSEKLDEVDSADAQKLLQLLHDAVAEEDQQAFEENARELEDILFFAES